MSESKNRNKKKKNGDSKNRDSRLVSSVRIEVLNSKVDVNKLRISSDAGYVTIMGRIDFTGEREGISSSAAASFLEELNRSIRKMNGVKSIKYLLDNWDLKDGKNWQPKGEVAAVKRDWLLDIVEEVEREKKEESLPDNPDISNNDASDALTNKENLHRIPGYKDQFLEKDLKDLENSLPDLPDLINLDEIYSSDLRLPTLSSSDGEDDGIADKITMADDLLKDRSDRPKTSSDLKKFMEEMALPVHFSNEIPVKSGETPVDSEGNPVKSGGTSLHSDEDEPQVATTISQMLTADDRATKVQAAMVLADMQDAESRTRIENALSSETDKHVIATLVKTLARQIGIEAIPTIEPFLRDSDDRVRANTVEAFEIIGEESIVSYLLPMLNDGNHRVKSNAIKALTSIGKEKFINKLNSLLESDSWQQRAAAVFAMRSLKPSVALPMLEKPLMDEDIRVSRKAVETAGVLGGRKRLIQLLEENPHDELLPPIFRALSGNVDSSELPLLSEYLSHPDSEIVLMVLEILSGTEEGSALVRECLKHPNSLVKAGAVRLLAQKGDPGMMDEFIGMLASSDSADVNNAIQFLSRLDAEKVVPAIMELIVPRDSLLSTNAVKVLKMLPADDGLMALTEIASTLRNTLKNVERSIEDIAG